ncbi:ABC-type sugar transport system, ATPase component [Rubellimicrobium thermophilum DSM 16684]|uniref:ABC-type sugar transport system, ATPase component n=1 Tax=Rubellimicrobium thermophilum DSM 16684 TaxID=1123069 RepID=S9RYY6_9RHOB|nr:ABC-type sugar transport system, ATPase component [Rubellimicrobium thermophilum DSM 16684]
MREGEILGIAGLMGSGRTELAMSIFGRSWGRDIRGRVRIGGREIDVSTVEKALASGLAYVTEDRKALGLVLEEPIVTNITLANLAGVSRRGVLDPQAEQGVAERFRQALGIRTPGVFQRVVNLSGGNQQKVLLSKLLFTEPRVLILDEPTRGIDVGAKFEIYGIMNRLVAEGRGVVMILLGDARASGHVRPHRRDGRGAHPGGARGRGGKSGTHHVHHPAGPPEGGGRPWLK